MPLQLKACLKETCDGLDFSDTTRDYSVSDPVNLGGYGTPNPVDGPADFDTYTFSFWAVGVDPSATATAVIDLLENVPSQSTDEDYDWPTFTFADLNVTTITSGVAYIEVVGVKDGVTYRTQFTATFTKELYDALKPKMAAWRPGTKSKEGCLPIQDVWNALEDVMCGAVCSDEQATDIIEWIRANLNNTCC